MHYTCAVFAITTLLMCSQPVRCVEDTAVPTLQPTVRLEKVAGYATVHPVRLVNKVVAPTTVDHLLEDAVHEHMRRRDIC